MPIDPAAPTILGPSPIAAATTALTPGVTLANRYRIVNQLGKGGMGEVYRADDLTLGVSVALKFLPPSLAADPIRLDRFKAEVRIARQISHPNICRVFDLVEATPDQPRPFITMEYVDGEDLASLLRRIGRLPHDKAVQIARQLCFGLAAAHEQGIIHRDLKPANIMLDGRGNARIMDFGIAVPVPSMSDRPDLDAPRAHFRAGTPGYMAPEQFAGLEVTPRADIYSLGLVLYELFTGHAAYDEAAIAELSRSTSSKTGTRTATLTYPSHFLPDLDPAVERIILRCLEPDPKGRPSSAIVVAAALPGGDPLAAAIAAGETPSPELVAESGAATALSPLQAWGRAAIAAALLLSVVIITAPWSMVGRVKPAKPPDALQDHATEVIHALGYDDPPADTARGLNARSAFIARINMDKSIPDKAARLAARPGPYEFWYRQSPTALEATNRNGMIEQTAPLLAVSGEILVRTDSSGRLELFCAIAPKTRAGATTPGNANAQPTSAAQVPDATIQRLFSFADLDPARFTPAEPIFRPFNPVDSMRSWTGALAEFPELPIRIHLGEADGRVVYFSVAYPWQVAGMQAQSARPAPTSPLEYAASAMIALVILATCRLVYVNLRTTRGDRTSAFRLALTVFLFAALNIVVVLHRLPSFREILTSGSSLSYAAFAAIEFWFFYIALEPYARRVFPQSLISWTKLFRGNFTDPLVGRHILIGLLVGATSVCCTGLFATALRAFYLHSPAVAFYGRTGGYLGGWPVLSALVADSVVTALMLGAGSMLTLVTGELASKRRWVGYLLLAMAVAALDIRTVRDNPVEAVFGVVVTLIPMLAIPSGGFLALVIAHITIYLGQMLPVGLDWTHWFAAPVLLPASILAALLILSARAASAGGSLATFQPPRPA